MKRAHTAQESRSTAKQISGFIGRFDPSVARLLRAARAALRKRLPTAIEQVYDNYHFLAIGFCTTERTSDCILSLAASAKGVALSFYYGAALPDPEGVLLGGGKQNRFVRLESAGTLATPAVASLIDAAVARARPPLPAIGRGYSMVKSVSAKQRPRQANPGRREPK
jgi:Domain of unknown function (DU1801)